MANFKIVAIFLLFYLILKNNCFFWYYIHITTQVNRISERVHFFCFWYLDEPWDQAVCYLIKESIIKEKINNNEWINLTHDFVFNFFSLCQYSNWYYLLLLALAGNSFVFPILDNISTSVWLWIQVSSGQRGQFLVHHGCSSEPLGPHPPRFTTLFPVLS